jgi:hypothetical protein
VDGAILQPCSVSTLQIGSTPEPSVVIVDESNNHWCGRSCSAAKKVAADFKISFARRSSAFSLFNAFSCSDPSVVTPGR